MAAMLAPASGSKGLALAATTDGAGAAGEAADSAAGGRALQALSSTTQQIAATRSAARPVAAARRQLHEKGLGRADSSCIAPCYGTATRVRPSAGFASPCQHKLAMSPVGPARD